MTTEGPIDGDLPMSAGIEAVFLETRAKLLRFLYLRGVGGDAEDILQEVWIKASQTVGPVSNPVAYLFRCAHNVAIDHHRSAHQRVRRELAWVDAQSGTDVDVDQQPDPERTVLAGAILVQVATAIDALGEPTATVFRLFRIEGVPQREIAARLGIALPTVEKHLQRAYKAMAQVRRELDTD